MSSIIDIEAWQVQVSQSSEVDVPDDEDKHHNNNNNKIPTIVEDDEEEFAENFSVDILEQYIQDDEEAELAETIPEFTKRPSITKNLLRMQIITEQQSNDPEIHNQSLKLSNVIEEEILNTIAEQSEDISKVKFGEQVEETIANVGLQRNKSLLSRAASTIKNALSPNEVPTIGISELEAIKIEKETLKSTKRDDLLKYFQTEEWFSSSTETNGLSPMNLKTGNKTAAGLSILQNESIHNPFFKEEQITAQLMLVQDEKSAKAPTPVIDWKKLELDKPMKDLGRDKGTVISDGKKRSKWLVLFILVIVSLITCCSILCLLCWKYYNGTEETTRNYFDRLSRIEKLSTIYDLADRYHLNMTGFQHAETLRPLSLESKQKQHDQIFYYNSFENIHTKYKTPRIRSIMTNKTLKNVFYGINYAPSNVISPLCGASREEVLLDIATLSKVTTRIRIYGLQCDQLQLTLDAIQGLGVNMTVSLGVWINSNDFNNNQQLLTLKEIFKKYPRGLIDSVIVGNEVLLRSDKADYELDGYLLALTKIVNGNSTDPIPVGTSEFSKSVKLLQNSKKSGINIHPFLKGISVEKSTKYTMDLMKNFSSNFFISEIGWPSEGGSFQNSTASVLNLQTFINEFICDVNKQNIEYYWFELFDEPWKKLYDDDSRGWESHWGLFDDQRKLKITLPSCL